MENEFLFESTILRKGKKKMKKIYNTLFSLGIVAMIFSSCSDWLDVRPSDEIKEEFLFETGNGYRTALNGIYRKLSTQDLYGQNLSWGIVDALGGMYNMDGVSSVGGGYAIQKISTRAFKGIELVSTTNAMWEAAWNIVANCNNLIQQVESADTTLFYKGEEERNMIWGEAIALRAYIQFDLLRLYAPAPSTNPGERTFIPYVDEYPAYVNDKQTVAYCLDHVVNDLKKAQDILKPIDEAKSFRVYDRLEYIASGEDRFLRERGYRLNYYAITALLARVYLYAGNLDMAYDEAMKIIKVQNAKRCFNFTSEYNITDKRNIKFYDDIIFTLYTTEVTDWDLEISYSSEDQPDFSQHYLCWHADKVKDVFGNEGRDDYRLLYQFEEKYWGYRTLKYHKQEEKSTGGRWGNPMLPMIRMSEVYYVAAEAICKKDLGEAREYIKKVKNGRGVSVDLSNLDENGLVDMIVNDAQRELFGEGQVFFMFKRLNRQVVNYSGSSTSVEKEPVLPTEENFVLPLPDSESNIK